MFGFVFKTFHRMDLKIIGFEVKMKVFFWTLPYKTHFDSLWNDFSTLLLVEFFIITKKTMLVTTIANFRCS